MAENSVDLKAELLVVKSEDHSVAKMVGSWEVPLAVQMVENLAVQ